MGGDVPIPFPAEMRKRVVCRRTKRKNAREENRQTIFIFFLVGTLSHICEVEWHMLQKNAQNFYVLNVAYVPSKQCIRSISGCQRHFRPRGFGHPSTSVRSRMAASSQSLAPRNVGDGGQLGGPQNMFGGILGRASCFLNIFCRNAEFSTKKITGPHDGDKGTPP